MKKQNLVLRKDSKLLEQVKLKESTLSKVTF
jgi:hypothetical protein